MDGMITAVSLNPEHTFSKPNQVKIRLLAGLGVEGDTHLGVTVQHRSRVKRDPTQPNLRQAVSPRRARGPNGVHLIHAELHDELNAQGFNVSAGQMGENITTRGVDLLGLPTGTRLHLGKEAVVEIKGLRNPCYQLDNFQQGLLQACLDHNEEGNLIRKAGVMGIVLVGGDVFPNDLIRIEHPSQPYHSLQPV